MPTPYNFGLLVSRFIERNFPMRGLQYCVLAWVLCGGMNASVRAQDANSLESYLRLHYVKQEHQIPMRDGVKLFTAIYIPRDTTRTHPMLMKRTPYSVAPYGADKYPSSLGPSDHFVKAGYIFVNQDVRG